MADLSHTAVFFDMGNTLASVRVSPTAAGDRIDELRVYPDARHVLETLRTLGVRLGLLSDPLGVPEDDVEAALRHAGLLPLLDERLVLYGSKASPHLFERAALAAREEGCETNSLLFVGENAEERGMARLAGFLAVPHPVLALPVLLRRGTLRYLRLRVPPAAVGADWRSVLRSLPLVPLHLAFEPGSTPSAAVYVIADTHTAAELDDLGFWVDRLGEPDEPQTSDLYVLRDDVQVESGFLVAAGNSAEVFGTPRAGQRVLASTEEGLFVAIPSGSSVDLSCPLRSENAEDMGEEGVPA